MTCQFENLVILLRFFHLFYHFLKALYWSSQGVGHAIHEIEKRGNPNLIALSISATVNPAAQLAMEKLEELHGYKVHMTNIPTPGDEAGLRRLGANLTSDPNFSTKDLFIS